MTAAIALSTELETESSGIPYPVSEAAEFVYKSKFTNWDESASVRSQPRRVFKGEDKNKLFFSPEVVPIANHPLICCHPVGNYSMERLAETRGFTKVGVFEQIAIKFDQRLGLALWQIISQPQQSSPNSETV